MAYQQMPKDNATRRRKNRITTAAQLAIHDNEPPPFPWHLWPRVKGERNRCTIETKREWARMWRSPMAQEWAEYDLGTIYTYIQLYERFQVTRDSKIAAELRQQAQRFGLDLIGRRRLGWDVEKPKRPGEESSQADTETDDDDFDPRSVLHAVS